MREINNPHLNQCKNETVWLSTAKLTINLFSHIFMSLVVLTCLWFSFRSTKFTVIELHIVLCVLGYQLFMSQGILVLSRFNSWSMVIKRRHRRCIHWFFEFLGAVLVIVGSTEVIRYKRDHFNTLHGILGLCALITTVISVSNGIVTSLSTKFPSYDTGISLTTASKCVHGFSGISTLFLSAACLHYGFDKGSFRRWVNNDYVVIVLKVFTWGFTIFVACEFWITMYNRIKIKNSKP